MGGQIRIQTGLNGQAAIAEKQEKNREKDVFIQTDAQAAQACADKDTRKSQRSGIGKAIAGKNSCHLGKKEEQQRRF